MDYGLMRLSVLTGLGGVLFLVGAGLFALGERPAKRSKSQGNAWGALSVLWAAMALAGVVIAVYFGWKMGITRREIPGVWELEHRSAVGRAVCIAGAGLSVLCEKCMKKRGLYPVLAGISVILFLAGLIAWVYFGLKVNRLYF